LIKFKSKDFSFIEDKPIFQLHEIFNRVKAKPNLTQNTAITLLCCFDDHEEKINQLAIAASDIFDVEVERNLTLLTIRHYKQETIKKNCVDKEILLEQKTPDTIQIIMK
jgi:aspartate kinase